jgi:hypothetical protein
MGPKFWVKIYRYYINKNFTRLIKEYIIFG